MKNQIYEKFMNGVRNTRMTRTEKDRVLCAIMETSQSREFSTREFPVRSPWNIYTFRSWIRMHRSFTAALAVVVIVVLGGGGAVSAAESALPGDRFYALKIDVVEPVKVALKVTAETKARAQSKLVNKRLEEAEVLALRDELDQEKLGVIESLIDEHTEDFVYNVDKVRERGDDNDADDISVALQADISAHANILARIDERRSVASARSSDVSITMMSIAAPAAEVAPDIEVQAPVAAKMMAVEDDASVSVTRMVGDDQSDYKETNAADTSLATEISSSNESGVSVSAKVRFNKMNPVRSLQSKMLERATMIKVKSEDLSFQDDVDDADDAVVSTTSMSTSSNSVDLRAYEIKKGEVKKYIEKTKVKIQENNRDNDDREANKEDRTARDEGRNDEDDSSWKKSIVDDSSVSLEEAEESLKSAEEYEKKGDKKRAYADLRRSERAAGKAETLFTTGLKIDQNNKEKSKYRGERED